MLSKEFKLSDTQITLIEEAQSKYENYDIEFVCEPSQLTLLQVNSARLSKRDQESSVSY